MAGAISTFRYLRTFNASAALQTQLSGGNVSATFNSEYIKTGWYDYIGLLVKVGTVTGTSPTLNIKAQISHDGGTTWHDVYPTDSDKESTSADTTNQAIMTEDEDVAGVVPCGQRWCGGWQRYRPGPEDAVRVHGCGKLAGVPPDRHPGGAEVCGKITMDKLFILFLPLLGMLRFAPPMGLPAGTGFYWRTEQTFTLWRAGTSCYWSNRWQTQRFQH
ncbi:MAG: hypothetical protein ACYSUD_13145 [Planctomycetota bacterium]|jgi:hypothetical protein